MADRPRSGRYWRRRDDGGPAHRQPRHCADVRDSVVPGSHPSRARTSVDRGRCTNLPARLACTVHRPLTTKRLLRPADQPTHHNNGAPAAAPTWFKPCTTSAERSPSAACPIPRGEKARTGGRTTASSKRRSRMHPGTTSDTARRGAPVRVQRSTDLVAKDGARGGDRTRMVLPPGGFKTGPLRLSRISTSPSHTP
jgi:hypothetical protein